MTVGTVTWNNSAMSAWLSQSVSSTKRHSTRVPPSSVWYRTISPIEAAGTSGMGGLGYLEALYRRSAWHCKITGEHVSPSQALAFVDSGGQRHQLLRRNCLEVLRRQSRDGLATRWRETAEPVEWQGRRVEVVMGPEHYVPVAVLAVLGTDKDCPLEAETD